MSDAPGWPPVPEEELAEFYATADRFLQVANGLVSAAASERIAAAFIYAGSRFTAFAMQAQADDPGLVDAAARDWLVARFEEELRDHMMQQLRSEAYTPVVPGHVPDAALDVLMSLNEMGTERRATFLRLADGFIRPANDLIAEVGIVRTSAAMMHACTRFNAYVMQTRGLAPGDVQDSIVNDFRQVFSDLLSFHLGQSLVADREA